MGTYRCARWRASVTEGALTAVIVAALSSCASTATALHAAGPKGTIVRLPVAERPAHAIPWRSAPIKSAPPFSSGSSVTNRSSGTLSRSIAASNSCTAQNMRASHGHVASAMGVEVVFVELDALNGVACDLTSPIQLELLNAAGESLATLIVPPTALPVAVAPGVPATASVRLTDCGQSSTNQDSAVTIGVEVGGRSLNAPIGPTEFDPGCRVDDPSIVAAAAASREGDGSNPSITARISTPDVATAGDTLDYYVTITNHLSSPYPPSTCPIYEQVLSLGTRTLVDDREHLNCSGGRVEADGMASYEMHLQIPATAGGGLAKLTWRTDDGDLFAGGAVKLSGGGS